MKQEIINQLNLKFATRHSRAQNIAYAKLRKAQSNVEFSTLEKKNKTLTFELGKAMAFDNSKVPTLQKQLAECKNKQSQILTEMGLSVQDLIPHYSCKKCNDTGKIGAKNCECYNRELYALLLKNSGAKTKLANFAQFDETLGSEQQQEQIKKIKTYFIDWINQFPNVNNHIIMLSGKTGVGKTFLIECVADAMMKKGKFVTFVSATELNNLFLKYHIAPNDEKLLFWQMLTEPDLLVVDDLGTEPLLKNVTLPYLCALLNDRFSSGKSIIFSTNLAPDQILYRYGDRIFSRIVNKSDSKMFKLDGYDLRLKKH